MPVGSDLTSGHGDATAEMEQMLNLNSSQALTVFQAMWSKLSDGHMQDFVDALDALADVLDVVVGIIIAMKVEAIVQLGILAAQLIFDQAAAIGREWAPASAWIRPIMRRWRARPTAPRRGNGRRNRRLLSYWVRCLRPCRWTSTIFVRNSDRNMTLPSRK